MQISVERFPNNPLLRFNPQIPWMSKNVFNCGVILDKDGLFKMLFRAAYTDDQSLSDCGLAISPDGMDWYLLDKPVLKCGFNQHCRKGVEDPRIIQWIDGWYYIFGTAYAPDAIRVGIWRTKNFFQYEWVGIPFDWEDKDAAIIPEPIGGFAYLIHRHPPHIWISRTKDLSLKGGWQDSKVLVKAEQFYPSPFTGKPPAKIGIAGPPLKTPKGWLVITHTVHTEGEIDNRLYTLGFMVLDILEPSRILYIHPEPILVPLEEYEWKGAVSRVVFSCANVDVGDSIYLYWGGADTVICGGKIKKSHLAVCYGA